MAAGECSGPVNSDSWLCEDLWRRARGIFTMEAVIPRTIGLLLALAFLASGCITYSGDKALSRMSEEEKSMMERLSKISKGMTKAEVRDILGAPPHSETKDTWRYGMHPTSTAGTITTVNAPQTLSTAKPSRP